MSFIVVIPARMHSTRLPGKPLKMISGKPMIQHVYERAMLSGAEQVIVATDHDDIAAIVHDKRVTVVMTSTKHGSGTERIAEVIAQLKIPNETVVVNVQGDEPMIPIENIQQTAVNLLKQSWADIATLCVPITSQEAYFDSNVVKVVKDRRGSALYFSRAPIPWCKDKLSNLTPTIYGFRHIGIYAYQAGFIKEYVSWQPCHLEQIESLEQLRAIWNGRKIHVDVALIEPPTGVDTPEDLERLNSLVSS